MLSQEGTCNVTSNTWAKMLDVMSLLKIRSMKIEWKKIGAEDSRKSLKRCHEESVEEDAEPKKKKMSFNCCKCGKTFNVSKNLRRHMKTCMKNQNEEPSEEAQSDDNNNQQTNSDDVETVVNKKESKLKVVEEQIRDKDLRELELRKQLEVAEEMQNQLQIKLEAERGEAMDKVRREQELQKHLVEAGDRQNQLELKMKKVLEEGRDNQRREEELRKNLQGAKDKQIQMEREIEAVKVEARDKDGREQELRMKLKEAEDRQCKLERELKEKREGYALIKVPEATKQAKQVREQKLVQEVTQLEVRLREATAVPADLSKAEDQGWRPTLMDNENEALNIEMEESVHNEDAVDEEILDVCDAELQCGDCQRGGNHFHSEAPTPIILQGNL